MRSIMRCSPDSIRASTRASSAPPQSSRSVLVARCASFCSSFCSRAYLELVEAYLEALDLLS